METLTYIKRKVVATALRQILSGASSDRPTTNDEILQIPSQDEGRTIEVHYYRNKSPNNSGTSPVLVNAHGGGFMLGRSGSDDAFCSKICNETDYSVLDVNYRLSPEYTYPSGLHDIRDVIQWVLDQPDKYDTTRIALSGFSAGGNLTLAASMLFPVGTIGRVVAFYPVVDLHTSPYEKIPPENVKGAIPPFFASIFDSYYVAPNVDTKDPLVSPLYADTEKFPESSLFVTCGIDSLHDEATALAKRIQATKGKTCILKEVAHVPHAWDKRPTVEGSHERLAIAETYDLTVKFLSEH